MQQNKILQCFYFERKRFIADTKEIVAFLHMHRKKLLDFHIL